MKVVQVPFCYFPDPSGGTEVYVASLAGYLRGLNVRSIVVAPGERSDSYSHENIRVRRYPIQSEIENLSELYDAGNPAAAAAFGAVLDEELPDLVHFHALTRGASLLAIREAKRRRIPVIFTYHTPTVSCLRGTMMRWGNTVCDGALRVGRCAACTLQSHGVPRALAMVAAQTPDAAGRWLERRGKQGGIWNVLRMSCLVEMRHGITRDMIREIDHWVAVCHWVRDVLTQIGVAPDSMTLSRQGLFKAEAMSEPAGAETGGSGASGRDPLRLVFLGRLDRTKGLDTVLRAFASDPGLNASLDVFGVRQPGDGERYYQELLELRGRDDRIRFRDPIQAQAIVPMLRKFDFVVVPSIWLESGPLVVLEAFAAGTPVIGSNRGGIAELVRDSVDGLLVEAGNAVEWASAIRRCAGQPNLVARLLSNIQPPRTMATVAEEMGRLYQSVLDRSVGRSSASGPRSEAMSG